MMNLPFVSRKMEGRYCTEEVMCHGWKMDTRKLAVLKKWEEFIEEHEKDRCIAAC
jgi:hypothetical protein